MDNIIPIYFGVIFGFLFIGIGIGIKLGKHIERVEWNKLIQEGKLPKPKNR